MLVLGNFITAMTGLASPGADAAGRPPDRRARAEVIDLADAARGERYADIRSFRDYRAMVAGFDRGFMPEDDWTYYFDVSEGRTPFDKAVEVFFQRLSGYDGFRFAVVTDRAGIALKRIEIAVGTKAVPAVLWQNESLMETVDAGFAWRLAA